MTQQLISSGLQYTVYATEIILLVLLAAKSRWKRNLGLCLYVSFLFLLDSLARPIVGHHFGFSSDPYSYFYWITDAGLALGVFALICIFFRRACIHHEQLWRPVRVLLGFVLVLTMIISVLSLASHFDSLATRFIVEFSQNLYFACLVLNTMLYMLMQQIQSTDDELSLLVCGIGIQFAGEAACFALLKLTGMETFARNVTTFLGPACTLGMLLVWYYAVSRTPEVASERDLTGRVPALAEATVNSRN